MKSIRYAIHLAVIFSVVGALSNLLLFASSDERGLASLQQTASFRNSYETKNDTTVIISSSLIPTHPSLMMIDKTIESLSYLHGLPDTTPLIITVDGPRKPKKSEDVRRLIEYVQALEKKYNGNPMVTIIRQTSKINLVGNVKAALDLVDTEFVYLLQHDMPFIASVDHVGLLETFQSHPDEVRMVRFSPRRTLIRNRDNLGICGKVDFEANGVALSKTHTWSDQ